MELKIKKEFSCDVLVVGGGVAGFGAAMGAAASIVCQTGVKAKDVPYNRLREILIGQRAYLGEKV